MKAIGKITAKVVMGETLKIKLEKDQRIEGMRIHGRVDRVQTKPNQNDPEKLDVKLVGEFVATNVQTGEQFTSATLYPMGAGMADMMSLAKEGTLFALRVYLAFSSRSPTGYAFDYETAMEVKPSEAVTRMGDAFLSLAAPAEPVTPKGKGKQ